MTVYCCGTHHVPATDLEVHRTELVARCPPVLVVPFLAPLSAGAPSVAGGWCPPGGGLMLWTLLILWLMASVPFAVLFGAVCSFEERDR